MKRTGFVYICIYCLYLYTCIIFNTVQLITYTSLLCIILALFDVSLPSAVMHELMTRFDFTNSEI